MKSKILSTITVIVAIIIFPCIAGATKIKDIDISPKNPKVGDVVKISVKTSGDVGKAIIEFTDLNIKRELTVTGKNTWAITVPVNNGGEKKIKVSLYQKKNDKNPKDTEKDKFTVGGIAKKSEPSKAQPSQDNIKPRLHSFGLNKSNMTVGEIVEISYTVSDSGGSGLRQVELWKGKSLGNLGPVQKIMVSGNGPVTGKFTDSPSDSGTYFYGIHVLDNRNNLVYDNGAKSVIVNNNIRVGSNHWQYPVLPYIPGSYAGRAFFFDSDHLGEDEKYAERTEVKSIGRGKIVVYSPADGYGELVVVVEHDLGRNIEFRNSYNKPVVTAKILSIYGHLRPCRDRENNSGCTNLRVGDLVSDGTVIGYINDGKHNGDGNEHLHMGIRLSDMVTAKNRDPKAWYRGYERNTSFGTDFGSAKNVIEILSKQ